jgi:hypothetical protein
VLVLITWTGLDSFIARLAGAAVAVPVAAKAAAVEGAHDILKDSQAEVPVDSGALKASGRVEVTSDGAEVVYGGPGAPYAAVVHEVNPEHKKFLERPALEHERDVEATVAAAVQKAL